MKRIIDQALLWVDLAATVFLGIEGALAAIGAGFDLFGVLVLSALTALGGGVIRDLLIGAIPPNSVRDPRYPQAAFLGGLIAFLLYGMVRSIPAPLVVTLDAMGLGLFAVAGAAKALDYEIRPFLAVLMGMVTGVGGGTIRDLCLAKQPGILHSDIYAVAALAGAAVMVLGMRWGVRRGYMMTAGFVVCFVVRMVAWSQGWNLPKVAP